MSVRGMGVRQELPVLYFACQGVVEKCGFVNEGLSKQYLKINGVWEDHVHYVKLNGDSI